MKKLLLFFAVLVAAFVPFVPQIHAQTGGTIVTLENSPNIWTGINVYSPGNLQLTEPIAPCASGEFVTGLDATFAPLCSNPSGNAGICIESFLSSADGHGGHDYGYAFNQADAYLQSLNVTAAKLSYCSPGSHPVWTPMVESWPVALIDGSGSVLIPQSGGAGGVWGAAPVSKSSCTTTAGSTTVTCSNTTGLAASMAVGGIGLGFGNRINATPTGTTFQLAIPANLVVSGITTQGSNQVCGLNTIRGLATGQGISGTGIPASTTITAVTASSTSNGQCVTISNNATATSMQNLVGNAILAPVALTISGSWTTNITAEATAPVLTIPRNSASNIVNWAGLNYTNKVSHLSIQDPGYRTLTGVDGMEVWGQDSFFAEDLDIRSIKGTCLTLGGYDSNAPIRESFFSAVKCVNDGDLPSGQPAVFIGSNGTNTSDEINQIKFSGGEIVYPHGEGVTIGTYVSSHQGTNGPRLIFFGQNWQTEMGTADANAPNVAAPADVVHVMTGSQIYFDGAELAVPGYGRALYQQDNVGASNSYEVNGSSLISAGNHVNCTVTVVNGSPNITLPSNCIPQDNTFDGVGVQIGGVDYWFIPQGSVSGTTATLTANYAGTSGTATMTIGAGGFFFFNTAAFGVLDTRTSVGDIWTEIDPLAISLLGFGSPIVVGPDQGTLPGRGVNDNLGLLSYNTLDVNGITTLHGLTNTPGGIFSTGVVHSLLEGIFENPNNIPLTSNTQANTAVNVPVTHTCSGTTTGNDCAMFVGLNFGSNNQSAIFGWHYDASSPYGWVGLYGANHLLQWTSSMLTSLNPFTVPYILPGQLYSVAGVSLPTCTAALQGADAKVKDATAPTYMAPYAGNGGITAAVICSYNGSAYQWLTH